jgi:hypothetical protein
VLLSKHLVRTWFSGNIDSGFGHRPKAKRQHLRSSVGLRASDLIPELFILGDIATGKAMEVALLIVKTEMVLGNGRAGTHPEGLAAIASGLVLLLAVQAPAQTFPERTVKLVVPVPPGGSTDAVARLVTLRMQAILGQPVIIENQPGGRNWPTSAIGCDTRTTGSTPTSFGTAWKTILNRSSALSSGSSRMRNRKSKRPG